MQLRSIIFSLLITGFPCIFSMQSLQPSVFSEAGFYHNPTLLGSIIIQLSNINYNDDAWGIPVEAILENYRVFWFKKNNFERVQCSSYSDLLHLYTVYLALDKFFIEIKQNFASMRYTKLSEYACGCIEYAINYEINENKRRWQRMRRRNIHLEQAFIKKHKKTDAII